ncbi:MAG TPA: hypothetical protein PLW35_07970 [Verrucomicrobiota bacterium]|nr:hypothetical protein [Verrucomicrobiota bacterium]
MNGLPGTPRSRLTTVLIVVGLVIAADGLRLAWSPPVYHADALIGVRTGLSAGDAADAQDSTPVQVFSPASEAARICSTAVLNPVAEKLALAKRWGRTWDSPLGREEALAALRKKVHATVADNSGLIRLVVSSTDPAEAAEIANSIAQQYVQFVIDSIRRSRGDVVKLLRQNLAWQTTAASNLRKRIEDLRAESQMRASTNAVVDTQSPAATRAYALAAELARAEANLAFARTRWEELRNLDSTTLREMLPVVFPNELLLPELIAELAMIESETENIQGETVPENAQLEVLLQTRNEIQEQIEQRVVTLMAAVEHELQNLETQIAKLKAELDLARVPATAGSEQAGLIAQLERELQAREKSCEELRLQIMREETQTADIRAASQPEVIQQAEVPMRPTESKRLQGIALSVAGLVLTAVAGLRRRTAAAST